VRTRLASTIERKIRFSWSLQLQRGLSPRPPHLSLTRTLDPAHLSPHYRCESLGKDRLLLRYRFGPSQEDSRGLIIFSTVPAKVTLDLPSALPESCTIVPPQSENISIDGEYLSFSTSPDNVPQA